MIKICFFITKYTELSNNIQNFKEVYKLLNSLDITETIKNKSQLIKKININLKKPFRKNINKKN